MWLSSSRGFLRLMFFGLGQFRIEKYLKFENSRGPEEINFPSLIAVNPIQPSKVNFLRFWHFCRIREISAFFIAEQPIRSKDSTSPLKN